jgi:malate dehydrogenase (oxaloacetate-decarboxylating)
MTTDEAALEIHKKFGGKITTSLRDTPSKETLKLFYTPGVGAVSAHVAKHPEQLRDYTWTNNLVAVISDGSAVLGLGDIGPKGAMPVMEGKAMLFKHFADVDAIPIVLDVHSADEIVQVVKSIASSFGGINLEDIAAPKCFEIEERLKAELDIPVMHDDQHGTAIVVLAALINATKITERQLAKCRVVVVGSGAAGTATMKLLHDYAQPEILAVDSKGIVSPDRTDLNDEKKKLLSFTNPNKVRGTIDDAFRGADIFVGVSVAGAVNQAMVRSMAKDPIIIAMANPVPEIMPDEAKAAGAAIIATGRSDFPNQVNNSLAFPGIFRGALDNKVTKITDHHKMRAAEVLASLVAKPTPDTIIPSMFDPAVAKAVAAIID